MHVNVILASSNTVTLEECTVYTSESLMLSFRGAFPLPKLLYEARHSNGRVIAGACKEGEVVDLSAILAEGVITVQVSLVVGGKFTRTWNVEPIIVREADHGKYIIPEIAEQKARIDRLEAAVRELNAKINEL